jgi:nicotinamidase-related amidase
MIPRHALVCGVTTEVCVNTTVREANDRGFRCIVLSDCCASYFERAGSIRRVPAVEIEALVIRSVREHLKPSMPIDDRSLINTHVARVV